MRRIQSKTGSPNPCGGFSQGQGHQTLEEDPVKDRLTKQTLEEDPVKDRVSKCKKITMSSQVAEVQNLIRGKQVKGQGHQTVEENPVKDRVSK